MNVPMKIALVSAFPPGQQSLNEYGLHLAKGLADNTNVSEVIIIADLLPKDLPELNLGPKISVRRTWGFNDPKAGFAILRALHAEGADGVLWNVQTASFGDKEIPAALGLAAPALARLFGFPSGVIAHNLISGIDLDSTQLKGQKLRQSVIAFGGAMVTRALLSANYVTVTLRSYLDDVLAKHPKANIHLVPHGTFDTQKIDLPGLESRPKRIVTMGKFGTYKRLETLLAAFEMLRSDPRFTDYELVIGGTDHPGAPGYLDALSQKHAQSGNIVFQGYVAEDDIPEFFSSARLSVFDYSATTGSSGVLHQTASYGSVPVFPYIGDFVDVCRDEGLTGANYAPNTPTDMAEAMANMLRDTARAENIAAANRTAAMGMPFSDVIDFHITQFRNLQRRPGMSARLRAST